MGERLELACFGGFRTIEHEDGVHSAVSNVEISRAVEGEAHRFGQLDILTRRPAADQAADNSGLTARGACHGADCGVAGVSDVERAVGRDCDTATHGEVVEIEIKFRRRSRAAIADGADCSRADHRCGEKAFQTRRREDGIRADDERKYSVGLIHGRKIQLGGADRGRR